MTSPTLFDHYSEHSVKQIIIFCVVRKMVLLNLKISYIVSYVLFICLVFSVITSGADLTTSMSF